MARYIIDNKATVRQAAKKYGISKSTVHKDITERLKQISPALAVKTRVVLDVNKSERHIRGEWRPEKNICINIISRSEKAGIVSAFFCIVLY